MQLENREGRNLGKEETKTLMPLLRSTGLQPLVWEKFQLGQHPGHPLWCLLPLPACPLTAGDSSTLQSVTGAHTWLLQDSSRDDFSLVLGAGLLRGA